MGTVTLINVPGKTVLSSSECLYDHTCLGAWMAETVKGLTE